jgi:hypothetical protein
MNNAEIALMRETALKWRFSGKITAPPPLTEIEVKRVYKNVRQAEYRKNHKRTS